MSIDDSFTASPINDSGIMNFDLANLRRDTFFLLFSFLFILLSCTENCKVIQTQRDAKFILNNNCNSNNYIIVLFLTKKKIVNLIKLRSTANGPLELE